MRRTQRALALAATGLLLTVATACGDSDGGDGTDGPGGPGGSDGGTGLDALTPVPADDIADYAQQMAEKAPWGGTELDQWVMPMNEGDAAITALDVERQVTFSVDGGR